MIGVVFYPQRILLHIILIVFKYEMIGLRILHSVVNTSSTCSRKRAARGEPRSKSCPLHQADVVGRGKGGSRDILTSISLRPLYCKTTTLIVSRSAETSTDLPTRVTSLYVSGQAVKVSAQIGSDYLARTRTTLLSSSLVRHKHG